MKNKCLGKILIICWCACLMFTACLSLNVKAQTATDDAAKNEFQIWGGGSPASSTVFGSGRTKNARLAMLGLRYARRFNNNNTVNLKYTFDIIPLTALSVPYFRAVQNGGTFIVRK